MHEIGHAVHSLLSETQFQHLSGTRGTIDFVEPLTNWQILSFKGGQIFYLSVYSVYSKHFSIPPTQEFPSHLFEHFVMDPESLATFAAHNSTGRAWQGSSPVP